MSNKKCIEKIKPKTKKTKKQKYQIKRKELR